MSTGNTVTAFAPASIGNVGVGFDILGLAIAGAGDRVAARKTDGAGVTIKKSTRTCRLIPTTTRHQLPRVHCGMRMATHQAWS